MRIFFVSQRKAESLRGNKSAYLISITDPGCEPANLSNSWHSILRLSFHDVDEVTFPGANPELIPMSEMDAIAIVKFTHAMPDSIRTIYVHCRSGISRSAGVAKAIADYFNFKFDQSYNEYNRHVYITTLTALQNN